MPMPWVRGQTATQMEEEAGNKVRALIWDLLQMHKDNCPTMLHGSEASDRQLKFLILP